MNQPTIEDVRRFWEQNPLFAGEGSHPVGSNEFFDEHARIVYDDCLAGESTDRFIPRSLSKDSRILDLGCGIGFWTIEFHRKGFPNLYSCDLTNAALRLTAKRLEMYDARSELSLQNVERLTYPDQFFDHVNCQGVIHHTPDASAAVREIARVLKKDGTASVSVYYKNMILRAWPLFSSVGALLHRLDFSLEGRGRDSIYRTRSVDDLTRLYDGVDNPIGKSYSKHALFSLVQPYFSIEDVFLYFIPARSFPVRMPKWLHRYLAQIMGFMIHVTLRKR